jgi:hypothetical protein
MTWTSPYFGVQHLNDTPKGVQITVEDYETMATCSIINFNRERPWTNSVTERFDTAVRAREWGELKARSFEGE